MTLVALLHEDRPRLWLAFGVIMCLLPLVVTTGTLRILIFAHFLAIFAMSVLPALAQNPTAVVTGKVQDQQGDAG